MDAELLRGLVDSIQESARLLGITQAKKGYGDYTEADSRFEVAMWRSIAADKDRIELSVAQGQGFVMVPGVYVDPHGKPVLTNEGDNMTPAILARRGLRPLYAAPAQPDGVSK